MGESIESITGNGEYYWMDGYLMNYDGPECSTNPNRGPPGCTPAYFPRATAKEEYRRAVQLDPKLVKAYLGLGIILAQQCEVLQAEQEYRIALAQNNQYGEAHLRLADLLARTGQIQKARQHYQKAAESADPKVRQAAIDALL